MREIPVFSFVAYSGTGKTTYIEKLITYLKNKGVRVGIIKHDAHDFEIDKKGKDSFRFAEAGAMVVALMSDKKAAVMEYRPVTVREIISGMKDVDIIITEGFKNEGFKKILVYRADSGKEPAVAISECFAIISDVKFDTDTRQFPIDDEKKLAEYLLEYLGAENAS